MARKRKALKLRTKLHANWQIDYDYLDKLSPEELEALRKFTNEFYLSGSKGSTRDRQRAYKANQRDLMGRSLTGSVDGRERRRAFEELAAEQHDGDE